VRAFFHRFTQPGIQGFWRPLWIWLLGPLRAPNEGFSLDLDSTVLRRSGWREATLPKLGPPEDLAACAPCRI
jgi:hypothetical protein